LDDIEISNSINNLKDKMKVYKELSEKTKAEFANNEIKDNIDINKNENTSQQNLSEINNHTKDNKDVKNDDDISKINNDNIILNNFYQDTNENSDQPYKSNQTNF
jgi:hypothetical protein